MDALKAVIGYAFAMGWNAAERCPPHEEWPGPVLDYFQERGFAMFRILGVPRDREGGDPPTRAQEGLGEVHRRSYPTARRTSHGPAPAAPTPDWRLCEPGSSVSLRTDFEDY